jgi:hypothetical protein
VSFSLTVAAFLFVLLYVPPQLAFHIFFYYQMTYSEFSDVLLDAIKPENRSHVQLYYEL